MSANFSEGFLKRYSVQEHLVAEQVLIKFHIWHHFSLNEICSSEVKFILNLPKLFVRVPAARSNLTTDMIPSDKGIEDHRKYGNRIPIQSESDI
jgi:hypothetical protein